jgi:hypothetical protein
VGGVRANDGVEPITATTEELLAELARRYRVRYGRLEAVFHDGRPSPKVVIEHRLQRSLDES